MGQNLTIDAPFLHDECNTRVMNALSQKAPNCARFVGGCVRDAILGRRGADIDIATWLLPKQVIEALDAAAIKSVPTGIEHGTISAIVRGRAIEITTLRCDIITNGRHAEIAFTNDWHEDAKRRDFTCNSLYCDMHGQVFEPIAGAIDDCQNGRIRFVGNAELRVMEDYLRILRFFRFHAWFGKGEIDQEGLAACDKHKSQLTVLSRERVWAELKKILSAQGPMISVEYMAKIGVLAQIMGFNPDVLILENLIAVEHELKLLPDAMVRFMALLDFQVDIPQIALRFRMSNKEKDRLLLWQVLAQTMICEKIKANIYYYGKTSCLDALILDWTKNGGQNDGNWRAKWDSANSFTVPIFPIAGADLLAIGMKQGPELGKVFKNLEAFWVENDFEPSKEELMERV